MFSPSATLHSYRGVWGRIRSSVQSPPDPSRKHPTACTHFPPHFLYGSLKSWEVPELEQLGGAACCSCSRLGKTRKAPPSKPKKEKKQQIPPSISAQQKVWMAGKEVFPQRKPDPQKHQRLRGGSSAAALMVTLPNFLIPLHFIWSWTSPWVHSIISGSSSGAGASLYNQNQGLSVFYTLLNLLILLWASFLKKPFYSNVCIWEKHVHVTDKYRSPYKTWKTLFFSNSRSTQSAFSQQ